MIVIALETADENLRGIITRWLFELKPGTFAGIVSAKVRDFIWDEILRNQDKYNGALMVYPANNEMGFEFVIAGTPKRTVVDYEGIKLIKIMEDVAAIEQKTLTDVLLSENA